MKHKTETKQLRQEWIEFIQKQQETICKEIEACDGKSLFTSEEWMRPEGDGGGGLTKVIQNGNVFEKGGVNTSVVYGKVTDIMRQQLTLNADSWFASGISIVLHPVSPMVPTIHCNYRLFELYNEENEVVDQWFGGGTDLTPYYLFEEDAIHFHKTYKNICDSYDSSFYAAFKKDCDNYFVNAHRNNERRGIGGIFYDHKRPSENMDAAFWMNLAKECAGAFISSYLPIVENRKTMSFKSNQKHWQEIRRGRYTEFNLVHDRGTLFGLKTGGRIESILMSLPPTVRFEYNYLPPAESEENKLLQVCLFPREWV